MTAQSTTARLVGGKYRKMRLIQERLGWDIHQDVPWAALAAERPLLPTDPIVDGLAQRLSLDAAEILALSQLLGLMAVRAISEHEKVLGAIKDVSLQRPLDRFADRDDLRELGEQFFAEEQKHSQAFARYIDHFAAAQAIERRDLLAILPSYDSQSIATKLFKLNLRLGGRAAWWLVLITEEESLEIHRQLRASTQSTEPLFRELNHLHYQEEVRHMSFAPLMLRTLAANAGWLRRRLMRFDYLFAELLHVAWSITQLLRLRRIMALEARHPFFAVLGRVQRKLATLPLGEQVTLLLLGVPYASAALDPQRHRAVRSEIKRHGELGTRLIQRLLRRLARRAGGELMGAGDRGALVSGSI